MTHLHKEISVISFQNENWKLFLQTAHKDYYISTMGRVISVYAVNFKRRHKYYSVHLIKPYTNRKGYLFVKLKDSGRCIYFTIHKIVATSFMAFKDSNATQINHIDGNKKNNMVDNLEWCTGHENVQHAVKMRLFTTLKPVYQYDFDGKFVAEFSSVIEAQRKTNIKHTNICACCLEKVRQSGGYQWRYIKINNIGKVRDKKIADNLKTRGCKMVAMFQNDKQMKIFNSVKEAGAFIGKSNANVNISSCALGKRKNAYGYQWKYI